MAATTSIASYAGLISLATASVFAGAIGSLPRPKRAGGAKVEDEEDDAPVAHMESGDAWLFPVLGSAVLGGLYLVIKYLGKEWINWLMRWYFTLAALYTVPNTLLKFVRYALVGEARWRTFRQRRLAIDWRTRLFSLQYTTTYRTPTLALAPLAMVPVLYAQLLAPKPPALLTDVMALSFAHEGMSLLRLDSFSTGAILLSGLFVYDIWWVFGTKVMVSVATSLDVPIKLLWPKALLDPSAGFMMLGLGDIVVPGLFVATGLRFDRRERAGSISSTSTSTPYFAANLAAYALGLVATMTVMHTFEAAQPALLYLSPACILAFVLTAVSRGELQEAWAWKDVGQEEKEKAGTDGHVVKSEANGTAPSKKDQ